MAKYFPEGILIGALALVALFAYRAAHNPYNLSLTVEVAPAQDVIGSCRYQGRYWKAKPDPNGAFRCYLKDAP